MAKPFDATTKHLIETHPADWLALLGHPATRLHIIDADLSTISSEADKVIRVEAPHDEIVHLDLQAGYDRDLGDRTLEYNVLLSRRHKVVVHSIVILLRPEADRPSMAMTGKIEWYLPDGRRTLEFVYDVVRVWELPTEGLLAGGLGTLPLAPLSNVAQEALPGVIYRMEARIEAEASKEEAADLWTATYILMCKYQKSAQTCLANRLTSGCGEGTSSCLMGLKYSEAVAGHLLKGVRAMQESVTYQAILREGEARGEVRGEARGRAQEARTLLLRLGSKRFGVPNTDTLAAIDVIEDVARLELLAERVLDTESWAELLGN
jgi:hypothetical protein